MSPSPQMKEEIRGKRERHRPRPVRGKTEVTLRKMLQPKEEREGNQRNSLKDRERPRGSCPQLEGKWCFEKPAEGQSDFIHHCRQLSEREMQSQDCGHAHAQRRSAVVSHSSAGLTQQSLCSNRKQNVVFF